MAIPVGYALGYVYGGSLGPLLGWRLTFLSEASLMLPFVSFAFLTTPIPFSKSRPPASRSRHNSYEPDDVGPLLLNEDDPCTSCSSSIAVRSPQGGDGSDRVGVGDDSSEACSISAEPGHSALVVGQQKRRKRFAEAAKAMEPLWKDVSFVLRCGCLLTAVPAGSKDGSTISTSTMKNACFVGCVTYSPLDLLTSTPTGTSTRRYPALRGYCTRFVAECWRPSLGGVTERRLRGSCKNPCAHEGANG
jgi:hypothetical protein